MKPRWACVIGAFAINLVIAGIGTTAPLWAARCSVTTSGYWENGQSISPPEIQDYFLAAFEDGVTANVWDEMDVYVGCDAEVDIVRCAQLAGRHLNGTVDPRVQTTLEYNRSTGAIRVEVWLTRKPAVRRLSVGKCSPRD